MEFFHAAEHCLRPGSRQVKGQPAVGRTGVVARQNCYRVASGLNRLPAHRGPRMPEDGVHLVHVKCVVFSDVDPYPWSVTPSAPT